MATNRTIGPTTYAAGTVPNGYVCTKCEAAGVKLWREYQTAYTELYCAACAPRRKGSEGAEIDEKGYLVDEDGCRTDQIGPWLVPAVPLAEGDGYWGYTSVPKDGVVWWKALPTYGDAHLQAVRDAGLAEGADEATRGRALRAAEELGRRRMARLSPEELQQELGALERLMAQLDGARTPRV